MKSEFLTKAGSVLDFYVSEGLNSVVDYYLKRELYWTKYGVLVCISKALSNTGQNSKIKRNQVRAMAFLWVTGSLNPLRLKGASILYLCMKAQCMDLSSV